MTNTSATSRACRMFADNKYVSDIFAAAFRRVMRPDLTVDYDGLVALIRRYVADSENGTFQIVITDNEAGPAYNLVFHHGPNTPKVRVALIDTATGKNAGSFRALEAVCAELIPEFFHEDECRIFEQVMTDRQGSMHYSMWNGVNNGVRLQWGEIWP